MHTLFCTRRWVAFRTTMSKARRRSAFAPAPASSLHQAAASGDVASAARLLDNPNEQQLAPVDLPSQAASVKVDVNSGREDLMGRAPLHVAADKGHAEMSAFLVGRGADVDARDAGGARPLHYAAAADSVDVVASLLAASANPRARDDRGEEAIHWAASKGARGTALKLVDAAGVPPDAITLSGWSPLHLAALNGRAELLTELLSRLARLGVNDAAMHAPLPESLLTPAHLAARANQLVALEALVAAGADVTLEDAEGRRPVDMSPTEGVRAVLGEVKGRDGDRMVSTPAGENDRGGRAETGVHLTAGHAAEASKGGGRGDEAEDGRRRVARAHDLPPVPRGGPFGQRAPAPPPGAPRDRNPRRAAIAGAPRGAGLQDLNQSGEEEEDVQERIRRELREKRRATQGLTPNAAFRERVGKWNKNFLNKYSLDKHNLFAPNGGGR